MPPQLEQLEEICRSIGEQLKDLAVSRGQGYLSEQEFIDAVLRIEAEEVAPRGLTLTASNTLDDWTVMKMKVNGRNGTCLAFEFLPETGELRQVGFCQR